MFLFFFVFRVFVLVDVRTLIYTRYFRTSTRFCISFCFVFVLRVSMLVDDRVCEILRTCTCFLCVVFCVSCLVDEPRVRECARACLNNRLALLEAGCAGAEASDRDSRMWTLPPVVPFGLLMQRLETWLRKLLRDSRSAERDEAR